MGRRLIEKILQEGKVVERENIKKISGSFRNNSYIIEKNNKKYFLKVAKNKNIKRETNAINLFKNYNSIKVPEIIYQEEGYLLTGFIENFEEIASEEISFVISDFQFEALKSKIFLKEREYFKRSHLDNLFFKNKHLLGEFPIKNIESALKKMPQKKYNKIPRITVHGDAHTGNIKLLNGKPLFLNLEFSHNDYLTFDISTNIYSQYDNLKKILINYLDSANEKIMKKFSKDEIIDFILTDTIRICNNDIIKAYKNLEGESLKLKLNHSKEVLKKLHLFN